MLIFVINFKNIISKFESNQYLVIKYSKKKWNNNKYIDNKIISEWEIFHIIFDRNLNLIIDSLSMRSFNIINGRRRVIK
jgi:hypothetical protein